MLVKAYHWYVNGEGPHKWHIVAESEEEASEQLREYLVETKQKKLLRSLERGEITFSETRAIVRKKE